MKTDHPNFDPIARHYRWLERLFLGPILQQTRTHHLPALKDRKQALILGDGDGRFAASLLQQNPALHAHAIDISPAMIDLLCANVGPSFHLRTQVADVRTLPPTRSPDLIVTHFLLDCLTQPELEALVTHLTHLMQPGALWLISDFRIPKGPLHYPALLYVRALYLAFRMLTGLRVTRLPDHVNPLRRAGLTSTAIHRSLFGLLTTELWQSPKQQTIPPSTPHSP